MRRPAMSGECAAQPQQEPDTKHQHDGGGEDGRTHMHQPIRCSLASVATAVPSMVSQKAAPLRTMTDARSTYNPQFGRE